MDPDLHRLADDGCPQHDEDGPAMTNAELAGAFESLCRPLTPDELSENYGFGIRIVRACDEADAIAMARLQWIFSAPE